MSGLWKKISGLWKRQKPPTGAPSPYMSDQEFKTQQTTELLKDWRKSAYEYKEGTISFPRLVERTGFAIFSLHRLDSPHTPYNGTLTAAYGMARASAKKAGLSVDPLAAIRHMDELLLADHDNHLFSTSFYFEQAKIQLMARLKEEGLLSDEEASDLKKGIGERIERRRTELGLAAGPAG